MSLSIIYEDIQRAIARNLGWDRNLLTSDELQSINDAIATGLREFYSGRSGGDDPPHNWSFLMTNLAVSTTAAQAYVSLPSDFSLLPEGLSYGAGVNLPPISLISDQQLRALQSKTAAIGAPKYASVRASSKTGPTTYQLSLWPTPDAIYSLSGRYRFEPAKITIGGYPLGGSLHAEAIMTACLVASDKIQNPEIGESKYEARYRELIKAAVGLDKRLQEPTDANGPYPLEFETNASLSTTKRTLQAIVGGALKIGGDPQTWSSSNRAKVAEIVRSGMRSFYYPEILPGEREAYRWSFLFKQYTLTLASGDYLYDMPSDFSALLGTIHFSVGEDSWLSGIEKTTPERIMAGLSMSEAPASRPSLYAIRAKQDGITYEMMFYPVPSQDYSVTYRYVTNPLAMESDASLPLGEASHAQTLIEMVLAAAEISEVGKPGAHSAKAIACLRSSISRDRQLCAPDTIGYSWDRSIYRGGDIYDVNGWHKWDEHITEVPT